MRYKLLLAVSVFAGMLHVSCNEPLPTPMPPVVARDTSITPLNAYSELFLDSLRLENFLTTQRADDSLASHMRNFYNSRNYNFAWFDEDGLTVQAQGFWNAHNRVVRQASDSSLFDVQLHQTIDTLLSDSSYFIPREVLDETELLFTQHFFSFVQFAYTGKINPRQVQWHIPRRRLKPVAFLDSFLHDKDGEWKSLSRPYYLLQTKLIQYSDIARGGGWGNINFTKNLKPGSRNKTVAEIKKRLQLVGLYPAGDTTEDYNPALEEGVKNAERAFGLKDDGVIDKTLINQLNVSVEDRIQQMLINLERMKWMPEMSNNFLLANIPEYRLHVMENGQEVLGMNIVVGKTANRTVIFSDELKYVVFSPYWNIPRSIVRNEIYPAMKRSSSYLRRKNMEVTGYSGGLPIVRQKPGPGNALGRVKFIFPNSYNIYFHDTSSRSLFSRQQRAFSHGCVRLHQPFELAQYLLRDQPEWTDEKIRQAMNSRTEKWVTLRPAIPVFITYFTSWVDQNEQLHFAEDVYGHDRRMAAHLFQ